MLTRTIIVIFAAVTGACCTPAHGYHIRPSTSYWYEYQDPTKAGLVANTDQVSADLLVVADTHASYVLAPHELRSNTYITDGVVSAAVRPPQIDQWGTHVLEWILTTRKSTAYVVHLGDAANISCTSEFRRFSATMNAAMGGTGWIYTPGNHDSMLMGNWAYQIVDQLTSENSTHVIADTRWGRECGLMPVMDKKALLDAYLAAKGWTSGVSVAQLSDAAYECTNVNTGADANIAAVLCSKRGGPKYASFIVQVLKLANQTVLLVDSTDIPDRPGLFSLGGVWGGVSTHQVKVVDWLLKGLDTASPIVLGTHYPVDALDDNSQRALTTIIDHSHAIAVLTAHTHSPTAERPHHLAGAEQAHTPSFLEINVGSVAGWPMEYVYLSVTTAGTDASLTASVHSAAWALYGDECKALSATIIPKSDYYYYTHYTREFGYAKLVRAMYAREHQYFDNTTDPKNPKQLPQDFQQLEVAGVPLPQIMSGALNITSASVARYERCQAVFASAAEGGASLSSRTEKGGFSWNALGNFVGYPMDPFPEVEVPRILPVGLEHATQRWTLHRPIAP